MKKLIYILLLLPLLAMQCEKENKTPDDGTGGDTDTCDTTQMDSMQCEINKLPPITTTGQGTFGCLLNGKAVITKDSPSPEFNAGYFEGLFQLRANFYIEASRTKTIIVQNSGYKIKDGAIISINNESNAQGFVLDFTKQEGRGCVVNTQKSEYQGEIQILRFDSINKYISFTFEFTHIGDALDFGNEYCFTDTNVVTHGRADIKY